jgi:hypothetical protein
MRIATVAIVTITLFIAFNAVKVFFGIPVMLLFTAIVAVASLTFLAVAVNGNTHTYTKKVPVSKSNPPRSKGIR